MNLIGKKIKHKTFGDGVIEEIKENRFENRVYKSLAVRFQNGSKQLALSGNAENFITADDAAVTAEIQRLVQEQETETSNCNAMISIKRQAERKEKNLIFKSTAQNGNISFKCNYCNGGEEKNGIGFLTACTKSNVWYNIAKRNYESCSHCDVCADFLNGQESYENLKNFCKNYDYICYESQMLRCWRAFAGYSGGEPCTIRNTHQNALCVLTTRFQECSEEERCIFALFLIDEVFEGDHNREGCVSAQKDYRLYFTKSQAQKLLYWNYHTNPNDIKKCSWSTGLFRYLSDLESAQILKEACEIKKGTEDEKLAKAMLKKFCDENGLDENNLGKPSGALTK